MELLPDSVPAVTVPRIRKNVASVRLAERPGMTYEGEVEFFGERCGRYAAARPPASSG
jgi:hypothetical protein